ncbi:MAG: hypothetical protein M1840_002043 [Geoglossum simile]|nr:MAG: hypothetical protein M1840_002043 [Geoglossum simile]
MPHIAKTSTDSLIAWHNPMNDALYLHSFGRMAPPPGVWQQAHRRQRSLESILDFHHQALSTSHRTEAEKLFTHILDISDSPSNTPGFDRVSLLRLSLEYNPSPQGRDNFLNYVLRHYLPTDVDDVAAEDPRFLMEFPQVLEELNKTVWTWRSGEGTLPEWVVEFTLRLADHFVYYFFLPMKGRAMKTPQPTPSLTPVYGALDLHTPITNRLSNLRATCLIRDQHRCVISGLFDRATAQERSSFVDDGGLPLTDGGVISTEVSHIIPHALGEEATREDSSHTQEKAIFWDVMKLFNPRAEQLLDGVEIDRPFNAMTLSVDLHKTFGGLEWYLEEDDIDPQPNAYIFKASPGRRRLILNSIFWPQHPRRRVVFTGAGDNSIDLPDAGLLARHRACSIILGMSGAGDYIEKLLRDDEDVCLGNCVQELQQGKVNLGGMISWRLGLNWVTSRMS